MHANSRPFLLCEDHLEYSKAFKWLMRRPELNPSEKLIYIRLRNCTYKMGEYWVSHEYLSHECGIEKRSVIRCLKKLELVGLISKTRHGKKMFNSYAVHIHEWMTDENKFNKSEVTNCHITESEVTNMVKVKCQNVTSIYKEQNKKQNNICEVAAQPSPVCIKNEQEKEIWEYWKKRLHHAKAVLDEKRKKAIQKALKNYSVEQIKSAIDGCALSDHHMQGGYDDITLILRDAAHIERFIKIKNQPAIGKERKKFGTVQEVIKKPVDPEKVKADKEKMSKAEEYSRRQFDEMLKNLKGKG